MNSIKIYWSWLTEHWRKGLKYLFGASILVQVINIGTYFLYPFLYPQLSFANFLIFGSITGIIGMNANGRFYVRMLVEKNPITLHHLLHISFILSISVALLFYLFITFTEIEYLSFFKHKVLGISILIWATLYLFSIAITKVLEVWLSGQQQFKTVSLSQIIKVGLNLIAGFTLGKLHIKEGMILALSLSQCFTVFYLLFYIKCENLASLKIYINIFKQYISLSSVLILHSLCFGLALNIEIYLIKNNFNDYIFSSYAFADKFLRLPFIISSMSFGSYFFRVKHEKSGKALQEEIFKLIRFLAIIGLVFSCIVYLLIEPFIISIWGKHWIYSAFIIKASAFRMGLSIILGALLEIVILLDKQQWKFLWDIFIMSNVLFLYFILLTLVKTDFLFSFKIRNIVENIFYITYLFLITYKLKNTINDKQRFFLL